MGIGPATIKSKSKLLQPSKRFGYLYNVEPGWLFPTEQGHSSGAADVLGIDACKDLLNALARTGCRQEREPRR